MASAENSFVGCAKQTAKGAINSTDAAFKYFMFNRGGIAPSNQYIPDDSGIGSGALLANIQKGGVFSAGAFEFVPRALSVGNFLHSVLGKDVVAADTGTGHKHTMTFDTDDFTLPYYTFRSQAGGLQGETFLDCRVASLAFSWRAADHIRAQAAVIGGTPASKVSTTAWTPAPDLSPSFVAPVSTITGLDSGTPKVIRGSIVIGNSIPLDEQWIIGSYAPDDFDVVTRSIVVTLAIKVTSAALYNKMAYDPADGGAWAAGMMKDAELDLTFTSTTTYDVGKYNRIKFLANSSATAPNIAWTVQPISLQAGKLVTMVATGTFIASASGEGEPITVELYNTQATGYGA